MLFYDFEVFKHDWLVVIMDPENEKTYEIVNDPDKLKRFYEKNKNDIWVGYNSRSYDQYILKGILLDMDPKKLNDYIIVEGRGGWSYSNAFHKIQLYNFDIMTQIISLKTLEGFMGNDIQETSVSFDIDRKLTISEIKEVLKYCRHDVEQTIEVFLNRYEDFESQLLLLKAFNLNLKYISKTQTQLSAIILGAKKQDRNDEFDIEIVKNIKLSKYDHIRQWYLMKSNLQYTNKLEIEIFNVKHTFAWGGLHGALENYIDEGFFVNSDVTSFYPTMMIIYNFSSRNILNPNLYKEIYDTRIAFKAEGNPLQLPYKLVLNKSYGAMKDMYNNLYDPRQANNVCINGQLMLLDLIEKVELKMGNKVKLIQTNTDGVMFKLRSKRYLQEYQEICDEWSKRTQMGLEHDYINKVIQKDVNNYMIIQENGKIKSKGAYLKKLSKLDYDLPIINKALKEYFINNTSIDKTINNCNDLIEFQKIVKVSSKYKYAKHNGSKLKEKTFRVFASRSQSDGSIFKVKNEIKNPEKIANTPDKCFILNENINEITVPRRLNKKWYIELANKRLKDYIGA